MACKKPGATIESVDQFSIGMIVENYRVGTCRVVEISSSDPPWVHFEYAGISYPILDQENPEIRIYRNADPIHSEGEYLFSYAQPGADL